MGELFALINAAGWSVSMVFARRAQQRAQVGILGGLYCSLMVNTIINALMLLVTVQFRQLPSLTGKGMLCFVLAGICNSLVGRGLLFSAVSMLGAARAGVIKATTPVFALMEGVFLLHEVITPLDGAAILVVLGGVLLIALEGVRSSGAAWDSASRRGIWIGLAASFFLALGNLFRKMGVQEIPESSVGVLVGSVSGLITLSIFLQFTRPGTLLKTARKIDSGYVIAGVSTSVALYFLFTSIQMIPLSIANSLTAVEPLFTLLLSRLLIGKQERPTPMLLVGAACTVLGAVLLACF